MHNYLSLISRLATRVEAVILIDFSIISFSNFHNFTNNYYAHRLYLPIIPKIIHDLMLIALETANIYYQLSGFLLVICNKLSFSVVFLLKNKNQLIVGLKFSKTELIQISYANK